MVYLILVSHSNYNLRRETLSKYYVPLFFGSRNPLFASGESRLSIYYTDLARSHIYKKSIEFMVLQVYVLLFFVLDSLFN